MSFLKRMKPNKPTASLEGYFVAMLAKSKFGKTTFAVDLAKEFYGNLDSALLIASEVGYKTMSGVYAIPVTGFDYAENDEDENQKGFIEVVDELIENKEEIPFRFIIIDTITALERYATKYVIKKASREDGKRYSDISEIPWGRGYSMVAEAIYEQIDRLKKNSFGVFIIGHEKTKKITNRDGFEYDFTTFNVLTKTSDIIEREADMIIYGDMQTEKGADGKVSTNRKLKFRSDGNILCGTRFRNFPEEIDNDVTVFLDTFKEAVLGLYDGDEKAVEKAQKEQREETEKQVQKSENKAMSASVLISEIENLVKDFEIETKKEVAQYFKENLGQANFRSCEDVKALAEALEFVKSKAE